MRPVCALYYLFHRSPRSFLAGTGRQNARRPRPGRRLLRINRGSIQRSHGYTLSRTFREAPTCKREKCIYDGRVNGRARGGAGEKGRDRERYVYRLCTSRIFPSSLTSFHASGTERNHSVYKTRRCDFAQTSKPIFRRIVTRCRHLAVNLSQIFFTSFFNHTDQNSAQTVE